MEIQVSGSRRMKSSKVIEYALRRLKLALDRFEYSIERVRVRFVDVNGPRGGEDKQCQITLRLKGSRMLVLRQRSSDIYTAIDLAAEVSKRKLARCLKLSNRPARVSFASYA